MGQVGFSRDRVKETEKLPVFNPKDKEHVRAALLTDLQMRYVHTLTKPVVRNGKIVQDERTNTKSGEKYYVNKTDFVGRFICLGDEGILEEDGLDPKNCPACKVAAEEPDKVKRPEERYAVTLFVYNTKPGSFEVDKPFGLRPLLWSFPQKTYNSLVTKLTGTFGDDHIKDHDVLVEVKSQQYRNYEISFAANAEWAKSDRTKDSTEEALEAAFTKTQLVRGIAQELTPGQVDSKLLEIDKEYSKLRDEDDDVDPVIARAERRAALDNGLGGLSKRSNDDEDDEDEAPRSRRRRAAAEDDEDEAPKRTSTRRSAAREESDEDEAPKRTSSRRRRDPEPEGEGDGETIDFSDLLSGMGA